MVDDGAKNANDYASKLGSALPEVLSYDVTVQREEVSGEIVHRVMIGPVLPIEEKSLLGSLSEWGVRGAWLLPEITVPIDISLHSGPDQEQDVRQPHRGFRNPNQSSSQPSVTSVKSAREQDDFNLVRLSSGSAKFPDPRNKH